ncbi:putative membrane protein [Anaerovibrio sp. JC8]|uniref:FAD-dependent oxidoreductase n=1 Tax=Anaerovibrio sp. JC8 TaxID=1240085 RepID=UPI000A0C3710|nr:FAD-dependent oxidoreductase [Anaerovibrio sp. JC8]ORT99281.1 putative membrane protein [Anaerovibrio sp. JC8]
MKLKISRREFMKISGAAAAGLMLSNIADTNNNHTPVAHAKGAVNYAGRQIPLLYEADICVVGGGPAGVAAAYTAGKKGASAVIIEKGITLGGLQTMGNVIPCMTTWAPDSDTDYVREVKKRLGQYGIAYDDHNEKSEVGIWTNPEVMSLIYDELCQEAKVEILYNTTLVDTIMKDDSISVCIVQTIAGLMAVKAKTFIDCSGDAILARSAKIPCECGFEKTGKNQPMSFRFEMGGIDIDRVYQYVTLELGDDFCPTKPPHYEFAEARHRTKQYILEQFMVDGIKSGELTEADAEYMQAFTIVGKPGHVSMNCPELPLEFSASDPLTYSRGVRAGRQMIHRLSQYFIKHMPGFENAYLAKEASMLGARESWRIKGKFYMTEDDYHNQSRFPDAVARTAWFIDAHGEKVSEKLPKGAYYEIPYRALITNEVPNLIVAGRCISASFILQASMRIQLTCMSIGEAAGIAAAWGIKNRIPANSIRWEEIPENLRSYVSR